MNNHEVTLRQLAIANDGELLTHSKRLMRLIWKRNRYNWVERRQDEIEEQYLPLLNPTIWSY